MINKSTVVTKEQDTQCKEWDGVIPAEVILKEGEYPFTVTEFKRDRHKGSEKIIPCNKAVLTLRIDSEKGEATAQANLYLCKSQEWRLSAFFRSIGLKERGKPYKMEWDKVEGAQGTAYFRPSPSDGHTRSAIYNNVVRFRDPKAEEIDDITEKG